MDPRFPNTADNAGGQGTGNAALPQQFESGVTSGVGSDGSVPTLAPGTRVQSEAYPNGQSVVMSEEPIANAAERRVVDERVRHDYEFVSVARPVEYVEKVVEVPTRRRIQTKVPRVQVREVVREIEKEVPEYREHRVSVPHKRVVDKYVEVPVPGGVETKYVPRVEVHERVVQTTKPTVKWVERVIEVPQIKEVVRYVESNADVEQVIRYVPKPAENDGAAPAADEPLGSAAPGTGRTVPDGGNVRPVQPLYGPGGRIEAALADAGRRGTRSTGAASSGPQGSEHRLLVRDAAAPAGAGSEAQLTPRQVLPLGGGASAYGAETGVLNYPFGDARMHEASGGPAVQYGTQLNYKDGSSLPPSPRLEECAHLLVPRVEKTVEVEKEVPVTVDVPVPFMVPQPVQIPVEVPVIKFRDHFIPVPVRRHVIPRVVFSDDVYEVECVREKPVLVIEDRLKPVPVDAKIRLKERDVKVKPVDPAELSQADFHAMWLRVNADLLERTADKDNVEVERALFNPQFEEREGESTDERERRYHEHLARQERLAAATPSEIADPETRFDEAAADGADLDFGPLPLHPGHPLMMTFLQNQWMQAPSMATHNLYTPEMFRLHASALDSLLHRQPHQVNVTAEQGLKLGPLPNEVMPCPWTEIAKERPAEAAQAEAAQAEAEAEPAAGGEAGGAAGSEGGGAAAGRRRRASAAAAAGESVPQHVDDGIPVERVGAARWLPSQLCGSYRTDSQAHGQRGPPLCCCCGLAACNCGPKQRRYPVAFLHNGEPVFHDERQDVLFQRQPDGSRRYFDSNGAPLSAA